MNKTRDYHIRVEYQDDPILNHAYSTSREDDWKLMTFLYQCKGIVKLSHNAPRLSITYKHYDQVLTVTCPNDDAYNALSSFTVLNIPTIDKNIIILDKYRR